MSKINQYQDENFSLQVQTFPGCQVKFIMTISPQEVKNVRKSTIKKIGKEVSLPGFRKGKAPDNFIEKNFSDHIENEWKNDVATKAFNKAVKVSSIYPFTNKSIKSTKIESFSLADGAVIVCEFESNPEVPSIIPTELKIEEVLVEPVSEAKIEQIIEDVRYQFANWEEVKDRPVQVGDFVDIDIENLDNPGEFICKDSRFELVPGKSGVWLIDLLIGMNPGESREGTSAIDEGVENPNFVPTRCLVTLNSVYTTVLPAFDDELAKKAKVESAEELRGKIVKDLHTLAETTAQQKKRALVAEAILKMYQFDLPESIIVENLSEIISHYKKISEKNLKEGETLEGKIEEYKNKASESITKDCCWQALIQKYVKENKIEVSEQEVMIEVVKASYSNKNLNFEKNYEKIVENIHSEILLKKVLDDILEKMQ